MEDEIFANKVVKKVKKEFAPISIKKDEYYYHPTFYIKDLAMLKLKMDIGCI